MKILLRCTLLAMIAMVAMPLDAQSTGRIRGRVTDSNGNPIANATVVLKRLDINLTRQIKVDARGVYLQVGLDPREFEMAVSAEGYVEHREVVKIPLGDVLEKDVTLRTSAEMAAAANPDGANPVSGRANEGISSYNEAVKLFNEKDYAEAMNKLESVIAIFNESAAQLTDDASKEIVAKNIEAANKLLAFSLFEVGQAENERRNDLWLRAEPILKEFLEKEPEDAGIAQSLANIAGFKGDAEAEKMYTDLVEKIRGPIAGNSYNRGVDLYNAGNLSEAKPHLKRAIEIDPNMPESYYLLGICEISDGDVKAAKAALQKYLELAPGGKWANDVKEMLSDPMFR